VDQPERRIWHRAASFLGTDEDLASEFERAADRSQRRGAIVVAISALDRAARLSEDDALRGRRLLYAAELAFELGRHDLMTRLLDQVDQLALDENARARSALVRESLTDGVPGDPIRVQALVATADGARRAGDTGLALNLLLGAALRCWWADPGRRERDRVIAAVERVDGVDADPRVLAILAIAAPIRRGALVTQRLAAMADGITDAHTARLLGFAAHIVGDYELASRLLGQSAGGLRRHGRLAPLAQVLSVEAWALIHLGDFPAAESPADEGNRLGRETAQPIWTGGARIAQSLLAGIRGDFDRANALAAEGERVVLPRRLSSLLSVLQLARGVTALSGSRYREAYEHLSRMFDPADPAHHYKEKYEGIGYFAEAAARCGQSESARDIIAELEAGGVDSHSPMVVVAMRFARAILADDDHAEKLFETALVEDSRPFSRARLQLAYGTFLRRTRRDANARPHLRAARDTFDGLGAGPWGERARRELRASGERSRRRTPSAREQLTPQELQIAQLVAAGLSNRDIGQQLYLSHRTISSHLYRIFPKIGVTSRSQVGDALGPVATDRPPKGPEVRPS
jgi:DNA-binding CsgD family transcriptional regulator